MPKKAQTGDMMQYRQLALSTGFLIALASTASAQEVTDALGGAGRLIGDILGGIFQGIAARPEIWMKVILFVSLFAILFAVFKKMKLFETHKGGATTLAIALALGAIAPLPNELVTKLFGISGFVGSILVALPVIVTMYLTYSLIHKEGGGQEPGAFRYGIALLLWFIVLAIMGAVQATFTITGLATAKGIGAAIAFCYIIYCIFGIVGNIKGTHFNQDSSGNYIPTSRLGEGVLATGNIAGKAGGGLWKGAKFLGRGIGGMFRRTQRAPHRMTDIIATIGQAATQLEEVQEKMKVLPVLVEQAKPANIPQMPNPADQVKHEVKVMETLLQQMLSAQQELVKLYPQLFVLTQSKELKDTVTRYSPRGKPTPFNNLVDITGYVAREVEFDFSKLINSEMVQPYQGPKKSATAVEQWRAFYGKNGGVEKTLARLLAIMVNANAQASRQPPTASTSAASPASP